MTPLWKMPYNEQLREKHKWSQNAVRMINERVNINRKGKRRLSVTPKIYHVKPSVSNRYFNSIHVFILKFIIICFIFKTS